MYRAFEIKNFRGFRDLSLDSLERVNLIAGQNNVGKTALLQAIYLHLRPDYPDLGLSFSGLNLDELQRQGRISSIRQNLPLPEFEDLWGNLFWAGNTNNPIEIIGIQAVIAQVLRITPYAIENASFPNALHFEFYGSSTQTSLSQLDDGFPEPKISDVIITTEGRHRREQLVTEKLPISRFLTTRSGLQRENAELFSKLEIVSRQGEILSILKLIEPRLQRLTILVSNREPMIHGDIGIGRLLPISMMGEGMGRLVSIILAIANTQNGVVLIDEIENGLHYSVMSKVWGAIAQAARQSNVQIFATTHSWECICAAHEAFTQSGTYDFRLHRLDRIEEDIKATTYTQEMLDTAIKTGLEVR